MMTLVSQAAIFTMLYSDSLARFVFEGDENFSVAYLPNVGESGFKITVSLALLAFPSMFSGYLFKDFFLGFGSFSFADTMFLAPHTAHFFESDYLFATWRITPVITSFFLNFLVVFGFDFLIRFKSTFISFSAAFLKPLAGLLQLVVDFFALNWFYDACLNY